MPFILAVAMALLAAWNGARTDDFNCDHQEWVAHHMHEQLGWSLKKGREVAKEQCRIGRIK